jgi:hypothetical protein
MEDSIDESDSEQSVKNIFSVSTQNRFDERHDSHGRQYVNPNRKRKKGSRGSIEIDAFVDLSTDEKLVCIFEQMNKNFNKIEAIEKKQEKCENDMQKVNNGVCSTNQRIDQLENICRLHTQTLKQMSYHSIDQEARSRRNNIIFYGVTENLNQTDRDIAYGFMEHDLVIDTSEMYIERAHRLGTLYNPKYRNTDDPKRPLIVKFKYYTDTEIVMQKAYKLRGTKFGVDRDYPKEIANARKSLYNSLEAKQARQDKVKMYIKFPAKLFIKVVMVKDMFPEWPGVLGVSRIEDANQSVYARKKVYSNETEVDNISLGSPIASDRNDEVFEFKRTDMYSEKVNSASRDKRPNQINSKTDKNVNMKLSLPEKTPYKRKQSLSRGRNRNKSPNINSKVHDIYTQSSDRQGMHAPVIARGHDYTSINSMQKTHETEDSGGGQLNRDGRQEKR